MKFQSQIASLLAATCTGVLLITALAACSTTTDARIRAIDLNQPASIPTPPADGEAYPLLPPSAERGAALYAQKCIACHGIGGEGDGSRAAQIKQQGHLVANLVMLARTRTVKPSEWHTTITVGRIQNLMPGFSGSLNAQNRWDVQAYVWSLGTIAADLDAGRAIYAQQCATCHGAKGKSPDGKLQNLADGRWLSDESLLEIAGAVAKSDAHTKLKLSEAQRIQVASAVRALGYVHTSPANLRQTKITGSGVLVLRAMNASPNGNQAVTAPVTLRALDANGEVFSRTAPVDAANIVTFTSLPQRSDYFYQAELEYAGGRFFGAPTQMLTTTSLVTDVIPYYETTSDPAGIRINNVLFAVQNLTEGELTMVEIYEFDYTGTRAYIGEKGRTLKLTVPASAKNVRFDGLGLGKRFFQEGDVIYDTDVVGPGTPAQRITMIYEMPYRNSATIDRRMLYPVDRWNVFLPETEGFPGTPLRVTGAASTPLKDEGTRDANSVKVRVYSGDKPTSDTLRFDLTGQPLGAEKPGNDTPTVGIAMIGLALTLAILAFVIVRVRRIRDAVHTPTQNKQQLLHQIAALDDDFSQGKLRPDDYHTTRARILATLKEIWE